MTGRKVPDLDLVDEIEADPILRAIDRGGGQTCDVKGVVRALKEAGYVIVKEPMEEAPK